MGKNFIFDILRWLAATIDTAIYELISWMIQGIFDISSLRVHIKIVDDIRNRIYAILGVLMIFKLTITFFKYIFDPTMMEDSKKGVISVLQNTITAVIILMLLPFMFNMMYKAQKIILPILPRVILADTSKGVEFDKKVRKQSEEVTVLLLRSFFTPYRDEKNDYASIDGTEEIKSLQEFKEHVNDANGATILGFGDGYKYKYSWPLTLLVGIFTIYILYKITISVTIRLYKLMILEMLAPIPVLSKIDITKTNDSFSKYIKILSATFLDLFITLGGLYLFLHIVELIANDGLFRDWGTAGLDNNPFRIIYLKLALIIAMLKFLMDVPGFVYSIFGLDADKDLKTAIGSFTGGISGGILGAAGGLIGGRSMAGALHGAAIGAKKGYSSQSGASTFKLGNTEATKIRDPNGIKTLSDRAKENQIKSQAKKDNFTPFTYQFAKDNIYNLKKSIDEDEKQLLKAKQEKEQMNYNGATQQQKLDNLKKIQGLEVNINRKRSQLDKANKTFDGWKKKYGPIEPYLSDTPSVSEPLGMKDKFEGYIKQVDPHDIHRKNVKRKGLFDPELGIKPNSNTNTNSNSNTNSNNNNKT